MKWKKQEKQSARDSFFFETKNNMLLRMQIKVDLIKVKNDS